VLTSTTSATAGGPGVTSGYTYDDAGNTLTRTNASGNAQTLAWGPEGHLATSADNTGTTSYLYDADGNRLISRDPTRATLFLPGQDVRSKALTRATTCTRYYNFAWLDDRLPDDDRHDLAAQRPIHALVVLDFDADGRLLGIEVIGAAELLHTSEPVRKLASGEGGGRSVIPAW
jgi:YD repeat-containing protein